MDVRGGEPRWRSHLVDQRCREVSAALPELATDVRRAAHHSRNLRSERRALAGNGGSMIDLGKHPVLGVGIDAVDYSAAVDRVTRAAHEGRPYAVSALAVHGVMTGAMDRTH